MKSNGWPIVQLQEEDLPVVVPISNPVVEDGTTPSQHGATAEPLSTSGK